MGVFFIKKLYVFKGFRAKSKLLLNVFKVLPSKHRKPHVWIREQGSKSAQLPEPTHAGTKYLRSGEPLTPIVSTRNALWAEGMLNPQYVSEPQAIPP